MRFKITAMLYSYIVTFFLSLYETILLALQNRKLTESAQISTLLYPTAIYCFIIIQHYNTINIYVKILMINCIILILCLFSFCVSCLHVCIQAAKVDNTYYTIFILLIIPTVIYCICFIL